MRILVTFAVDWEFRPWLRMRSFREVPGRGRVFHARIAGSDVDVVLTGVGAQNVVRSLRTAVDDIPDLCITSGLAGGLKREHRPGDVLVARATRSEAHVQTFKSDQGLVGAAVECGARAVDQFISAGSVVRTARDKSRLGASADAVDMESFAIMKEMSELGVRCVAVRSVADSAEMDVPCDFDRALDSSGRVRVIKVLGQVACAPRQAWPLAQLGARSSRAAASLVRYLDGYADYLAVHKEKMDLRVQHIAQ